MTKLKILQDDTAYSFRSYFELPNDTDEILAELGYSFRRSRLTLPRSNKPLTELAALKQQIEETIPYVTLSSEAAKREVLIGPILSRVAVVCRQILRIEYSLKASLILQGTLDYLIRSEQSLVVVEAKRDDLTRGFTQLAVEMVALAIVDDQLPQIYGAVTMGDLWVFGVLDRQTNCVTRDIAAYAVPDDLETVVRILVGILE
jgi:hypothetical protein